jgi:hypothetical protein
MHWSVWALNRWVLGLSCWFIVLDEFSRVGIATSSLE